MKLQEKKLFIDFALLLKETLLSFMVVSFFVTASVYAAELSEIDTISDKTQSQIILQLNGDIHFDKHYLAATNGKQARFYVDLYGTQPDSNIKRNISLDDNCIKNVRIGRHGTTTRVVLDLQNDQICIVDNVDNAQISICCKSSNVNNDDARLDQQQKKIAAHNIELSPQQEHHDSSVLFYTSGVNDQLSTPMPIIGAISDKMFTYGGQIEGFTAKDINKESNEDTRLVRSRNRLWVQYKKLEFEQYKLQGKASIEWDILDIDDSYGDSDNDLKLYEGYLKLSGDNWDISVGRQRVRWGKSDQLSPLDSINPEDMRQFITVDLEERKIPSWLARLRMYGSRVTLETIFMPWFDESELDYFDSDWALYRNLRQTIAENVQLPQVIQNYAVNLHVHERQPSNSLNNMSGALRLSWQTQRSDFAVSYRYGWQTLPTITSFPVKNIVFDGDPHSNPMQFLSKNNIVIAIEPVQACFKRQRIAGFEWESVFDSIGFRGEVAYIDHVSMLSSNLTSFDKKVAHLVTGIDYTSVDDWYFNLQTSWYRIFDYDKRILYFEQNNVSLLGELRKTLWRGNLELSTRYNYTVSDGSSYLQPAINIKYFPNIDAEIGLVFFSGDGDTLFGSYDKTDQVYAKIKFSF